MAANVSKRLLPPARNETQYSAVGIEPSRWPRLQKRYVVMIGVVLLICLGVAIVHLCVYLHESAAVTSAAAAATPSDVDGPPDPEVPLPPSPSKQRYFAEAAVCSDGAPCSTVGRDILRRNGSAMDAAVATMICNGVVNCQSMGLGGGFLMTFYQRNESKAYTLIAREAAPLKATADMYKDNPNAAKTGALAVGVPGELKGLWEAHKRFGKLTWAEVVNPAVKICEEGYNMTQHQSDSLGMRKPIKKDQTLVDTFFDSLTGKYRKAGSLIRHKKLCVTLRLISEQGGDSLYTGALSKMLVQDIQEMGGIITEKDLSSYRAIWAEPVSVNLRNHDTVYTVPPPGSGAILGFILNILDGYNFTSKSVETINGTVLTYHRIAESYKWAFAKRAEMGDSTFVDNSKLLSNLSSTDYADSVRKRIRDNATSPDPDAYEAVSYSKGDHGTAHMSVIAPNGDAVAITSTVNLYFGAAITSKQTGIILNSVMDDFSTPNVENYFGLPYSPANAIGPGKRPLSSMSPTIIVGAKGDVKMVVGASGGTKIISAVAYVIMRYLWFGDNIKQAVDASRFHHQLFPMEINYEFGVLDQVVKGLEKLGHKMRRYRDKGSVVCAVSRNGSDIVANADYRKGGEVDGF